MLELKPKPDPQAESSAPIPGYALALCERCDWRYLLRAGSPSPTCPHCFHTPLTVIQEDDKSGSVSTTAAPELYLPFSLPETDVTQKLSGFSHSIWFAPHDLTFSNLATRMQKIFLPAWLVDTKVSATWQAEVGFNYQVLSHQERYEDRHGWLSEEKTENRVRWEIRLGQLTRVYQNVLAPALEEQAEFDKLLGVYNRQAEQAYSPEANMADYICLPDRAKQDAWVDVVPVTQARAAEECRQAAGGDHIRNFRWSAEYSDQNWTLLLKPVYVTYYQDDEGHPQPVLINGQTGKFSAVLKASMRRAQLVSQRIILVAIVLFLISLMIALGALVSPLLLGFGVFGLSLAAAIGLMAIVPIAMVWQVNRKRE